MQTKIEIVIEKDESIGVTAQVETSMNDEIMGAVCFFTCLFSCSGEAGCQQSDVKVMVGQLTEHFRCIKEDVYGQNGYLN